ncbi:hypothetical protein [Nocardiopsis algeriensis]|uniref:Uncharacterized protein n=1 Tax=Nocardiopsis algeriensis TaxID=1478215 RepID=A0A841IVM3_9ACTN|nr:hypothetical protein [Nocardiopsis algeriensis]MBB6122222.1 hypothetical protein [Nocardiopsis algeriensis]
MFIQTRTARHPRRCDDCPTPILAGERYQVTTIPPRGHDLLSFDTWVRLSRHAGDCPDPAERGAAADAYLAHLRTRVDALTIGSA